MSKPITTEEIKELRDATGISIMQCKHALEEADGDMKKALAILKKTSSDIALKKGARAAKDGAVAIRGDGKKAVLVALHSETDFVARNEDFTNLLGKLAEIALSQGLEKMQAGAKDMIDPIIQKTGENIQLGDAYEVEGSVIGSYIHNNKIGVIVSLSSGTTDLAKDVAMHIAAMKPEYIHESEISDDTRKTITEVFEKEIAAIDKPEDIKKKMLDGKIITYFKEKTLGRQPFIKNTDETVDQLLNHSSAKIIEVKRYSI